MCIFTFLSRKTTTQLDEKTIVGLKFGMTCTVVMQYICTLISIKGNNIKETIIDNFFGVFKMFGIRFSTYWNDNLNPYMLSINILFMTMFAHKVPRTLFAVLMRSCSHSKAMTMPMCVGRTSREDNTMMIQTMDELGTAGRARVDTVVKTAMLTTWSGLRLTPSRYTRNNVVTVMNAPLPQRLMVVPNIVQNRDITGLTPYTVSATLMTSGMAIADDDGPKPAIIGRNAVRRKANGFFRMNAK